MSRYDAPSHGSSLRESQRGGANREGSAVSADFRSLKILKTEPKHGSLSNHALRKIPHFKKMSRNSRGGGGPHGSFL